MKKLVLLFAGIAAFGVLQNVSAQAQLINSWENAVEGWGTGGSWSSGGFSTTTGVTDGLYSWILTDSASPDYSFAIGGTATTALTAELSTATSVKVDVLAGSSFGYQQWTLTLNGGGLGYVSVDGYTFSQSPILGVESTLTWTIPSAMQATLAANLGSATSLNFQVGGGGAGTMEVDNLRIIQPVPEPGTMALMAVGFAGLLAIRRRAS